MCAFARVKTAFFIATLSGLKKRRFCACKSTHFNPIKMRFLVKNNNKTPFFSKNAFLNR
jgi:hypothetical protein